MKNFRCLEKHQSWKHLIKISCAQLICSVYICFFQEKEKVFYFSISGLLNYSKIPHFNVLMLKVFAFNRLNISSSILIVIQIPDIFLNSPASGGDGKSTLQNNFCCSIENSLLFIFGTNSATASFYQKKHFKFQIFFVERSREILWCYITLQLILHLEGGFSLQQSLAHQGF